MRTIGRWSGSMIIIRTAVISITPYLTDQGEHTALYKINNNVHIKISKIINCVIIILYSSRAHTHTRAPAHYTHKHTY